MHHQAQKGFRGIFVGIPQHQKGYIVYVPSLRKIISSYDVVFDESFSSEISYTPQPYLESMPMRPAVMYTPCDTSLRVQTGKIITFAQFGEGNVLTKTHSDAESGYYDSIMPPLMSEEYIDTMDSINESDNYLISTKMLEDIRDGS